MNKQQQTITIFFSTNNHILLYLLTTVFAFQASQTTVAFSVFLSPIHCKSNTNINIMSSCAAAPKSSSNDQPTKKQCVPCSSLDTSALLTKKEIDQRLLEIPSLAVWKQVVQEEEEKTNNNHNKTIYMLSYQFTAKNFQAAMDALNSIGVIAEREFHHPNFHLTNYREVQIDIYTHKLGGITENDFALADMIMKEVQIDYSPKWLKEHPKAIVK